jgi:hydroxyacylglutathione hydrolase
MPPTIQTISLMGVNCYLLEAGDGFILVDTGLAAQRAALVKALESAGCPPACLKLVILTHGDIDHSENCVFVRERYGAKIAMHSRDAGMVEHGDMGWNRKAKSDRISMLGRGIMLMAKLVVLFSKQNKFETFTPELYLEDGQDLSAYGCSARVLHLPGHSSGSIGVLTAGGDLICGDLLSSMGKPGLHFLIDNLADTNASLEKLKRLDIHTVYPGHGRPLPMQAFLKNC